MFSNGERDINSKVTSSTWLQSAGVDKCYKGPFSPQIPWPSQKHENQSGEFVWKLCDWKQLLGFSINTNVRLSFFAYALWSQFNWSCFVLLVLWKVERSRKGGGILKRTMLTVATFSRKSASLAENVCWQQREIHAWKHCLICIDLQACPFDRVIMKSLPATWRFF